MGKITKLSAVTLLLGANTILSAADAAVTEQVGARGPAPGHEAKGIVLLSVRWDRRWKCGEFENAQLRVIAFDKLPSMKSSDEDEPDLTLDDAPRVFTKPKFDNYAFVVEPGEYALSRVEVKVARSVSDVGFFRVPRSVFLKDGKAEGGSFKVGAGEAVYIGHFYVTCNAPLPMMWRYYLDGRKVFDEYLFSLKAELPWLDTGSVSFRLFETKAFGLDYKLP
jgi:hypothetical protein